MRTIARILGAGCVGAALAAPAPAQAPAPTPPPTRLEAFQAETGVVIIRGYTRVGSVAGASGSDVTVEAQEYTNAASGAKEKGLAVVIRPGGRDQAAQVAFVDYDEIAPLMRGIDTIWRSDRTVTRLKDYQASYRTRGGLEIATHGRGEPGVAAISAGWAERATAVVPIGELQRLGELMAAARAALDAPAD